ncbi:MAG: FtsB family cell division protein [Roseiflexus sp.]
MRRRRHVSASRNFALRERLNPGRVGMHILTLAMVVVSLWMMASFVGQIMTGAQLEQRREALLAENARIEATNRALLDQVEYAESPAYTEQIAREQLGLAAEGDTVILPTFEDRPANNATPTPVPLPTPAPQLNWRAWIHALSAAPGAP